MRIKRFPARTVPEAMAAVKKSLGPDAVLLETRRIQAPERRAAGELVEVVAAVDRNPGRRRRVIPPVRASFDTVLARAEEPVRGEDRRLGGEGSVGRHRRPEVDDATSTERSALPGGQGPSPHPPAADLHPEPSPAQPASPGPVAQPAIARLERRLDAVVEAVRRIDEAHPTPSPTRAAVAVAPEANELVAVTAALIALDRKVDTLLAAVQGPQPMAAGEVDPRLLAELAVAGLDSVAACHWGAQLQTAYKERPPAAGETPLMRLAETMGAAITCTPEAGAGEVHALLGSSGAGKSTLVVKLALRAQQLHRIPVHLITLDHARPEGAALLARYGEIFGLPLTRVSDATALDAAIDRLPADTLCLVDCPATSVDVEQQTALAALLRHLARRAVCHLLLPAATALPEMRRQVSAHRTLGIDRLAFTKVDEAASFGHVAAIAAESGLPVSWLTTGRQLPEDLADANLDLLRALVTRRRPNAPATEEAVSKNPLVATCLSDKEQR